ncbi:MAG: class I SAM-dependent methyltransferase [Alphaproteobacteria bacterium]
MTVEDIIIAHYRRPGLEDAIVAALAATGKNTDHIDPADLSGADEFHLGWRPATVAFAEALGFAPGAHVLDIGSGVGGPARVFAAIHSLRVTGIDLTQDYVDAANGLTRRCGLADRVSFKQANALSMPFAAASFDGAYTIHVAMNIADKASLYAEIRRVLKPGVRFGIYDIMRVGASDIPYPMPWAATAESSFVETIATYRRLVEAAGFAIESVTDRGDMVRELARKMRDHAAREGAPALGLHTLMGAATKDRIRNVMQSLEARLIAPTQIIARAI